MQSVSRKNQIIISIFILSLLITGIAIAEEKQAVPTPEAFLGKAIGTDGVLAGWDEIISYYNAIASASARVEMQEIGKSTNGRTMWAAFVTSPENHANMDVLLQKQREITYMPRQADEASRWADNKAFLMMSFSIHSSEVGAAQMGMKLLHHMATANSEDIKDTLDRVVLVILPSPNPDGLDWTNAWYDKWKGTEYEGSSYPHLYQTYAGHDNNRDWFMLNLPETRVINEKLTNSWFPQVIWDAHQMGSSGIRAFVPPFVGPPSPFLHPLLLNGVENAGHSMKYQMMRDDRQGISHSVSFSVWWNGGFRTTPYYRNSIGLLTELASARLATPIEVTQEQLASGRRGAAALAKTVKNPAPWLGGRWGLPEIIEYEFSAAIGLIKHVTRNSGDLVTDYRKMNLDARDAKDDGPGGYIFAKDQLDAGAFRHFLWILQNQGLRVDTLATDIELYDTTYEAGTVVVSGYQPFRPLIRSFMERVLYPEVTDGDSSPYDVSATTLVDLMGIDSQAVGKEDWAELKLEEKLSEMAKISEFSDRQATAKVISRNDIESYLLVNRHLKKGGRVSFQGNGDFVIAVSGDAADTGMLVKPIRVGLLEGNFGNMDAGWTRFLLERFEFDFKALSGKEMKAGALADSFDVIILPAIGEAQLMGEGGRWGGKRPDEYKAGIGEEGFAALDSFVKSGGSLITFTSSSMAVINKFKLPVKNVVAGLSRDEFNIAGSLLKLDVHVDDPLAFGMTKNPAAMVRGGMAFEATDADAFVDITASYATDNLLLSGYAIGADKIAGNGAMATVTHGDGEVVLFGFSPQFRAQTLATFKLVFNAIISAGITEE
jgi:hypothetical protein